MEIHSREDTRQRGHTGEALQCNKNFYQAAKEMGMEPKFVHTDKDWAEINAAKVSLFHSSNPLSCSAMADDPAIATYLPKFEFRFEGPFFQAR